MPASLLLRPISPGLSLTFILTPRSLHNLPPRQPDSFLFLNKSLCMRHTLVEALRETLPLMREQPKLLCLLASSTPLLSQPSVINFTLITEKRMSDLWRISISDIKEGGGGRGAHLWLVLGHLVKLNDS